MAGLRDDLIDLIAEEALVDKAKLTPEATLEDVGLDSVGMVSIAFAIEDKYDVEIADEAFAQTGNFGELLDVLEAAITKKAAA